MAMKKSKAETMRRTQADAGNRASHARRMEEFRARAERISHTLEGRKHSDSAALVREDRKR
jgi:hypothetical protein